jgi:hypothetical protein
MNILLNLPFPWVITEDDLDVIFATHGIPLGTGPTVYSGDIRNSINIEELLPKAKDFPNMADLAAYTYQELENYLIKNKHLPENTQKKFFAVNPNIDLELEQKKEQEFCR